MAVKIITDSACDLPQDLIREYDIEVVPLLVVMDGKEYADGQDISPERVYSAIRAGKVLTTNQAPAHFFRRVFTECVARGMSCIYIAFSSKLSGTCHTGMMVARQVREETQGDIEVVDTLCGSLGQGLLVLEAAKMAKAGAGKEQIVARVQELARHMEHIFTVDDLDYLRRGGRIGRASAYVGNLLNIKPLLHVKEGLMIPIEKVRGKKKAIKRLVELVEERCSNFRQTIGIAHADDVTAAQYLKELLQTKFGCKDIIVNVVGSVLGCHIGLGGVAVFFLNKALAAT